MERYKSANIASFLGIVGNVFLLIIKLFAGVISNSQAMISDAVNSAADIFSSVMTFIGNKIASKKPDEDHNLGHGKAEYIFSMLISLSMMIVAISLLMSSISTIRNPGEYEFSFVLIVVCLITIFVKLGLYIYTDIIAKRYDNLLIEANAKDHRNDCILTSLNLIASVFGMYNIVLVDSIVGIIVSLWIFFIGAKIFKASYDVLMDVSINEESKQKVMEIIKKYDEVKKVNHFNSTPVGYQYQISFTIFVDGDMSTHESHDIANRLEKEISSLDEIYLTVIHVNPLDKDDLKDC